METMFNTADRNLTVEEVALLRGLSPRSIYGYWARGFGPAREPDGTVRLSAALGFRAPPRKRHRKAGNGHVS
jgi:hypothetical protein